jgi:ElaB/YqjD/DUF883 family membrane-anchored ribosome-binding protein
MSADGAVKIEESLGRAKEYGQRVVEEGSEAVRHYADEGIDYVSEMSDTVSSFVRREPWIAVAGAFVIGYAIAHILRRTA